MFLTDKQRNYIIEALEKKIKGIDYVVKNKNLDESTQSFLEDKAMDLQDIIDIMRKPIKQ